MTEHFKRAGGCGGGGAHVSSVTAASQIAMKNPREGESQTPERGGEEVVDRCRRVVPRPPPLPLTSAHPRLRVLDSQTGDTVLGGAGQSPGQHTQQGTNSGVLCLEGFSCFKGQNKKKLRTVSAWLDGRTAEGLKLLQTHACATLVPGS